MATVAPVVCRQVKVCSNLFHTCNVHYPPACQYDMMRPVWLPCDGWDEDGSQWQSQAGSQGSQARQARLGPGSSRQADSRSSSRPAILSGLQSQLCSTVRQIQQHSISSLQVTKPIHSAKHVPLCINITWHPCKFSSNSKCHDWYNGLVDFVWFGWVCLDWSSLLC